jgi:leukotriene-A4 hydrolase
MIHRSPLPSAALALSALLSALLPSCRVGPAEADPVPIPLRVEPHSFANFDQWRTRHLELELAVDFGQQELEGFATLTIEAQRADAEPQLVLDTRALEILDVACATPTGEFAPALFRLGRTDAILGTPLHIDLPRGVLRVRVHYRTSPGASGLQWLEPSQTAGGAQPFLFSQSQAIHARSWIPCQDSPAVRATYAAEVATPQGLRAVMSAEQLGFDEAKRRWTFRMPQEIPSYLIAIAVGELEFRALGERSGVYAEPSVLERAASELVDTEAMIAAVERLYGPYRWGRYDLLVLPPSFPFGGMENPRLTFATPTILAGDKSLVALIAHELAHSWSGNLVTNASWNDFWLNEGFTVYLEQRIIEAVYGPERSAMETALGMRSLRETVASLAEKPEDTRLQLSLDGRDPDDGMTDIAYEKGAAFLRRLEELVGRQDFDRFLRAWFDEHAFQSVNTATFEAFLDERLLRHRRTLRDKVDVAAWIHGTGLPEDAPTPRSARLEELERAAASFAAGNLAASDLALDPSQALELLVFLRALPSKTDPTLLAALDQRFSLTSTGNNEILATWLELSIRAPYSPAAEALERFLTTQGRRKYLKPLYAALAETPEGLERARAIYAKAKPLYHGIARGTIEGLLGL